MSLDPLPNGKLKNIRDLHKWASLNIYLSVRGMSVTRAGLYMCSQDGLHSPLSAVEKDLMRRLNLI